MLGIIIHLIIRRELLFRPQERTIHERHWVHLGTRNGRVILHEENRFPFISSGHWTPSLQACIQSMVEVAGIGLLPMNDAQPEARHPIATAKVEYDTEVDT